VPSSSQTPTIVPGTAVPTSIITPITPRAKLPTPIPVASPTFAAFGVMQIIGYSTNDRPIESYRFGFGTQTIILVGGIHGGYEWNTILLAYEMIDYFQAHPEEIPRTVTLYIIPSANPDGQFIVTGSGGRFPPEDVILHTLPGRFNANGVDLNRNWDCEWQAEAFWQGNTVNAGEEPFSEPETQVLRRFFLRQRPAVVLFWHSKANGVYAGGCPDPFPLSLEVATIYGEAAGYPVYADFTAYPVTGDASDWLALQEIPSFSVELKTRTGLDWSESLAGVRALLGFYGFEGLWWLSDP
jgi:hypothetical protein